jgi:hypothetical protein
MSGRHHLQYLEQVQVIHVTFLFVAGLATGHHSLTSLRIAEASCEAITTLQ